jgi:hypothetical protein
MSEEPQEFDLSIDWRHRRDLARNLRVDLRSAAVKKRGEATQAAFASDWQAVAPTRVIPTSLPAIITVPSPPTVIPVSSPAPNTALRSAPDQFVRTYYALVSQQRYDLTWPMLTEAFKQKFNCCAPNYNYSEYVTWWDSVNYVDFGAVSIVSQSEDRAVVYVELYYVMSTGARSSVDRDPYIHLVYDSTVGNWRFDDKRATLSWCYRRIVQLRSHLNYNRN